MRSSINKRQIKESYMRSSINISSALDRGVLAGALGLLAIACVSKADAGDLAGC